jgi:hypothetical protein
MSFDQQKGTPSYFRYKQTKCIYLPSEVDNSKETGLQEELQVSDETVSRFSDTEVNVMKAGLI